MDVKDVCRPRMAPEFLGESWPIQTPACVANSRVLLFRKKSIISGPITEKFAKKNPVISRTIQIRGDQTLEDLHHAIFDAFGRSDEHMYEFQFGKGPMDPKAPRYVLPGDYESGGGEKNPPAGGVDATTIE